MPRGSLGVWHAVQWLNTAREGHATVVAQNPNDADEHFLYAFGGRDAAGTYLDSYEFVTINNAANDGANRRLDRKHSQYWHRQSRSRSMGRGQPRHESGGRR